MRRQTKSPSPALPKGRELLPAVFEAFRQDSFPLGKVGMGLLLVRFALAAGWGMGLKKAAKRYSNNTWLLPCTQSRI
ncbi:hypothetical protein CIK87_03050 [Prevotella sp. P5-64]|nr:hypothetical protein CIK87_03050 [Prevotella sp. P5-64]